MEPKLPGVPTDSLPYLALGAVTFRLVGPVVGLQSRRGYGFAEHARASGKPSLHRLGQELEHVTIELEFLRAFCDPDAAFAELQALAAAAQAVPLVWAASGVVRGHYVLNSLEETTGDTSLQGQALRRSARLELLEWVEPPRAPDAPQRAASAPARGLPTAGARTPGARRPPAGANQRAVPASTITRRS
ncbi:MAG TPA: phage tail protein [Longimicrobium sp.]